METKTKRITSSLIVVCLCLVLWGNLIYGQIENWVYKADSSGKANTLVYGADDNIYVAGYLDMDDRAWDFAVTSVDLTGNERWQYTYDSIGTILAYDEARDIVYGGDGKIYAAGYCAVTVSKSNVVIFSLDPVTGNELWRIVTGAPANLGAQARSICYGLDNKLYVAGLGESAASGNDFIVAKITNTGNFSWFYDYDGTANSDDEATEVVYGADNNIYAAGYVNNSASDNDFTVISIDTTGTERGVYTYNGLGNGDDKAKTLIYGSDGNIYAAGYSTGSGNQDFTVISIDNAGSQRWVYTKDGNGFDDEAQAIVYGNDGNIYAAGYTNDGTQKDFFVVKIDTGGNERWNYTYESPYNDEATSLAYDGSENKIYVAGGLNDGNIDWGIIGLDTNGTELFVYKKNSGGTFPTDVANASTMGPDGNTYSAGYMRGNEFTVISLNPTAIPEIWVWPASFYVSCHPGEIKYDSLLIKDNGSGPLYWDMTESTPVAWLSENPTSDSVDPGDSSIVTITFDATSLSVAHYYDTLIVSSNDPINPIKEVPVHLNVWVSGTEEYPSVALEDKCELASPFFNSAINLRFTKPSNLPLKISLYNITGERVYVTTLPATSLVVNVDGKNISRLSSGVYFLSVLQSEKPYPLKKLIKL